MNELRVKHLQMIQVVINRLAGNSFALKGWSIVIVSALFALSAKDANERYAILALLPALCFWGLDAYYLRQEILFRAFYEAVRHEMEQGEDQQSIPPFSLDTTPVTRNVDPWCKVVWSPTISWLHGPIVLAAFIVILISLFY